MLKLHVVTPEGPALEQDVDEVTVPGLLGEFGVLPGHVPLLAATRAGVLRYRQGSLPQRMAVGPGFAQVDGKDGVVVLAQKAVATDKIQRDTADKLLSDAEARLQREPEGGASRASAEAERAWAAAQLDALKAS